MYTLGNDKLTVEILDPAADQARFGTRYCTGGYIFQITDVARGPLLTGPTYPASFNWFDGQGIPDSFNLRPLRDPAAAEPLALVVGVGVCDLRQNTVVEFCRWEVAAESSAIRMQTAHAFAGYALDLERTLTLSGRTVRSTTRVHNTGKQALPLAWFPHPFYPQPDGAELCRLSIPVTMSENAGYELAPSGFISRTAQPDQRGFYQALDHAAHSPLVVLQRHPVLGLVGATTSYVPCFFPIWGNQHTFSWEPFFERTLAAGQEATWWIEYDF